ncbi:hypothetical protein [Caminibacter sp.]
MPRIFGSKLIDGVRDERSKAKNEKCKVNEKKKRVYQTKVEFESDS